MDPADGINFEAMKAALEKVVAGDIDYDVHKHIKYGEADDHASGYPELTEDLLTYYADFVLHGVPPEGE